MVESTETGSLSSNRRPASRRRVLLPGLIVYGHGAFTQDCKFRNLSDAGARLLVSNVLQLPSRFHVINIRDGVAYDARSVWNSGSEIGIKIDSVVPFSQKPSPLNRRLKELWLAKAPG